MIEVFVSNEKNIKKYGLPAWIAFRDRRQGLRRKAETRLGITVEWRGNVWTGRWNESYWRSPSWLPILQYASQNRLWAAARDIRVPP
jgi:hypothetical protein